MPSPAPAAGRADLRGVGATPALIALALALSLIAALVLLTDTGRELTPRHDADDGWVVAFSLSLGLLCCRATLGPRPRPARRWVAATGGSLVVAFIGCPIAGVTAMRLHEIADFAFSPTVERDRDLPIDAALVRHHRGAPYYGVWLRDYPALLTIDEQDYLTAFGHVGRVHPSGYCVHVTVQTSGRAMRVLARHGVQLQPGSLVRCPARVGAAGAVAAARPNSPAQLRSLHLAAAPGGAPMRAGPAPGCPSPVRPALPRSLPHTPARPTDYPFTTPPCARAPSCSKLRPGWSSQNG